MNATSLYVSTCRLVLQANGEDSASWTDLYRLIPYLRQSLSCTVCWNLLIEPYTPTETNCQHHVCRSCKGGKKKLKPSCSWCKNYDKYVENVQLRILLQCYKKLCEYMTSTAIFKNLVVNDPCSPSANNCSLTTLGQNDGTQVLVNLIQEGSGFADDIKTIPGLSSLPCVYTSTSTQTPLLPATGQILTDTYSGEQNVYNNRSIRPLQNGPSLYSVMYAGNGNKLTIKRKASELDSDQEGDIPHKIAAVQPEISQQVPQPNIAPTTPTQSFKKPGKGRTGAGSASNVKTGCRCGNATATPGKLTCCGQRCPCYTESKPCLECKCRGCRNPHTADGHKVCPVIPELQNYQLQLASTENSHITTLANPAQCLTLTPAEIAPAGTVQFKKMRIKRTRSKKPSVAKDNRISKVSVTTVTEESFAYNLEGCCTSSPNNLTRKPLADLNGMRTMLNGCGRSELSSGCEFTKLCDHVAIITKERRTKMVINHVNQVDSLVKKIMMFKMSIPPDVGNLLVSALSNRENTSNMEDESVLEDLSKLKLAQATRSRKRAVETKDGVFKRPDPRTNLRTSTRKTKLSSSSFKTPSSGRRCPPSVSSMIITPKINLNTPLSVLRLPKQGEMAVSMSGSPLLVSAAARDETPSISVPLPDGKILSILPNMGFEPNDIPHLDKQTRQQLETLKSHLQFYCDRIKP